MQVLIFFYIREISRVSNGRRNLHEVKGGSMAFELYFNVSKTVAEMVALAFIAGVAVYVVKDLTEDEDKEYIDMTSQK